MTDDIILQVIAAMTALGVIFVLQAIYRPKGLKIALLMIFLSLSTPLALYKPFVDSLGFSVYSGNKVKEEFLAYVVNPKQTWIHMWVIDLDSGEPRAYKTPYTKELEEALEKAKEASEEGIQQGVEIPPPPGVSDTSVEVEVSDLYDISPGGLKFNETAN